MGGVIFVVGPPTDPRMRPGFDEYQAMKSAAVGDAAEDASYRGSLANGRRTNERS